MNYYFVMYPSGVSGTRPNNYFSIFYFVFCCSLYSRNYEQLNFLAELEQNFTKLRQVDSACVLGVNVSEDLVNHLGPKLIHGLSEDG